MFYRSYVPAPPLGDFVARLWFCRDAPAHSRERILPSGTVELVINLRENEFRIYDSARPERHKRFSGAMASGPYDRFFVIDPSQHAEILGAHFKAGCAFPFLGPPPGELTGLHVDLDSLWGRQAGELRERLRETADLGERFRLLEKALMSHRVRPLERSGAVRSAVARLGRLDRSPRVRELAQSMGMSQRRLIQVFRSEVGLTPKLFGRVRRFQHARALTREVRKPDWARLAATCGYFDQSHMIRDFLAFSGLSPTDYIRQRSERVLRNHVPLSQ